MTDDHRDTPDSEPRVEVTRSVELDAAAEDVWAAIADPERRGDWLDDDDATSRTVRLDQIEDGRRLRWTWWRPDEEVGASTVEIVVAPAGHGTRVVVTESLPAAGPPRGSVQARAGVQARGATSRAAQWGHAWSYRLVGLELLFVAARAGVR